MAHDDLVCPHQFPPAIIRHAVGFYGASRLSYRDLEDLLEERGLDISYETVRAMVLKFGPLFRQRTSPSTPATNGPVASRRDGRDDCGPAVLAVARG